MTDRVVHELHAGFATRPEESLEVMELATQIADYILAEAVANDGFPVYARHPVLDTTTERGTAGRVLHGAHGAGGSGPAARSSGIHRSG